MIVDFDPAKDEANRDKHGLSRAFGARVFEDPRLTILPTVRLGDEEERFKAVGLGWAALHGGSRLARRNGHE